MKSALFKGIIIGIKSIVLLYFSDVLVSIEPTIIVILPFVAFGLINGFIDALVFSKIAKIINKIFFCVTGILVAFVTFFLSLYLSLPDILADYFVYGEGGGGREPGGWFAFGFCILIYFGISLISFPLSMLMLCEEEY